jgi:hypothetical protein
MGKSSECDLRSTYIIGVTGRHAGRPLPSIDFECNLRARSPRFGEERTQCGTTEGRKSKIENPRQDSGQVKTPASARKISFVVQVEILNSQRRSFHCQDKPLGIQNDRQRIGHNWNCAAARGMRRKSKTRFRAGEDTCLGENSSRRHLSPSAPQTRMTEKRTWKMRIRKPPPFCPPTIRGGREEG